MKQPQKFSSKIYLLIGLLCCCLPLVAGTKTIAVFPKQTIKAAIMQATPGDTIEVHPGIYYEHAIVIDKSLYLRGIGYPIIDAREKGEVLTIIASGVIVEGLQIQNIGVSYLKDHAAIRLRRIKNAIIRDNKLVNTFFGIYLERVKETVVENNIIQGVLRDEASSGNGIHAWYCEELKIRHNSISGHRDGIYFEFVETSIIKNNRSKGNQRYGLHFMFSNHDEYEYNLFEDNGAGVAVMFSKFINMRHNTFRNNWGRAAYGLLLKEIYDALIENNHFVQNTIAINVEGSSRISYQHNDFKNNGWAIKMAGGCLDNVVTRNNFRFNTLDLVLNSNLNNNNFNTNYWSEYSGYDLDRDGIGDVPHRPVKLFSYILDRSPESMVLLRSFFVDLMNFSEKVSPVFTPANVLDETPLIKALSL